jgi:hypothetical protein
MFYGFMKFYKNPDFPDSLSLARKTAILGLKKNIFASLYLAPTFKLGLGK